MLLKVRRTYRTLASRLDWKVVDATRPMAEVHDAVWSVVKRKFRFTVRISE